MNQNNLSGDDTELTATIGSPDKRNKASPSQALEEIVERFGYRIASNQCSSYNGVRRACEEAMKLEHDWWLSLEGIEDFIKERAHSK
jgi:phosphoserine aminotransferase